MFVDDTLLLGQATIQEATKFKKILIQYEIWSGQMISVEKSAIQFSPNVKQSTRNAISTLLGMSETASHGKYLGLPTTMGISKKAIFVSIVDKVKRKVVEWKSRLLSKAGKEIFIKSVLQAIPTLCKSKSEGGLGFRDLRTFNMDFLSKQAWRLITDPDSLLSRAYKERYFLSGSIRFAQLGQSPSYTWRSLIAVRDMLFQGIDRQIGNGQDINIWNQMWLPHTWSKVPITPCSEETKDWTVSDLIDQDIGVWKIDKVRLTFYEIDQHAILYPPLLNLHKSDMKNWPNHLKGILQ
ncbi:hypothetical protein LIER_32342 [Lithospermum erythrorhizon]|uniref:Reverse transcriptase n=1 Tax=Lithospermum erythrorhizon TaxID=34254 RepID=A0AAV3RVS3_LITER